MPHITVIWRNSKDYNSWTYWWIMMKLRVMVSLRVKVLHQIYFVQDQTHNLWQARVRLIFTRRKCPCLKLSARLARRSICASALTACATRRGSVTKSCLPQSLHWQRTTPAARRLQMCLVQCFVSICIQNPKSLCRFISVCVRTPAPFTPVFVLDLDVLRFLVKFLTF